MFKKKLNYIKCNLTNLKINKINFIFLIFSFKSFFQTKHREHIKLINIRMNTHVLENKNSYLYIKITNTSYTEKKYKENNYIS